MFVFLIALGPYSAWIVRIPNSSWIVRFSAWIVRLDASSRWCSVGNRRSAFVCRIFSCGGTFCGFGDKAYNWASGHFSVSKLLYFFSLFDSFLLRTLDTSSFYVCLELSFSALFYLSYLRWLSLRTLLFLIVRIQ
ncbi:hypothetical protein EJF18_70353 [Clavispora lusitaniae]|uniref:Uncharacterized protein n=1 Tax=Clavispora lusitaniae TaxID=36911 RepID=A0ACD0WSK6_CLALS|nr:hypothetical protein EJF14_70353 [Clavispora lusitaniae]QFZ35939.1 hypothetical protein EJF16_70353 [Clavispora lusitaniae]QFZ41621.1 hypothetical protein EJF15_70353 [Clavispora lusitaniae]QFZ47299.1 hypothetical protein EJF18_70353 [Clavispora lusitaniae]QFZ52976.1 hypothetical protein EJF17_70353 [Clavispora lusitaniae]